jgi:hypothetical protein
MRPPTTIAAPKRDNRRNRVAENHHKPTSAELMRESRDLINFSRELVERAKAIAQSSQALGKRLADQAKATATNETERLR